MLQSEFLVDETSLLIFVLEIGVVIIFSVVLARVLGKRGIPQVLGLILAGVLVQFVTEFTGFPNPPTPEMSYIITTGALGFIGYKIGSHLDFKSLREESWGLTLLLVGNAVGSFIIVALLVGVFFQDWILALLLGSIAMATAPASTSEVIREYNAQGPLSQTILFIIAFDDILAVLFFNIALNYSESVFTGTTLSLLDIFLPILLELVGSVLLGVFLALLLSPFHIDQISPSQSAEVVFPAVLICIAVAGLLELSVILSCITLGFFLSNFARCQSKACVNGVDRLSTPIIALFFILVGFEMDLAMLFSGTILLIIVYSLARGAGKSIGSYITARLAKMPDAITNNIPYALITQAGVAVGLAAFAYSRLLELRIEQATLTAITLLDVVAVSVVIAEIIGPLLLKYSLRQAGELGLPINNSQVDQYCEDD